MGNSKKYISMLSLLAIMSCSLVKIVDARYYSSKNHHGSSPARGAVGGAITGATIGGLAGGQRGAGIGAGIGFGLGLISGAAAAKDTGYYDSSPSHEEGEEREEDD